MNTDILSLAQPSQIELEISNPTQHAAQQKTQNLVHQKEKWQAYLNQLTLDSVISWLQEEVETVISVSSQASLLSSWTLVHGTAITLNQKRLILIPSEAIDRGELRVPQEWIDIPNWAGDYYFAITVNPDDNRIQIWGYTTHLQLKEEGEYDNYHRYYVLNADQIFDDVSAFWVAQELCPQETTRAVIPSLPQLSMEQAENLLQRLSTPKTPEPRLAIPFNTWGALLSHDGWRQRLYERRQGLPEQRSILQWLESGVSQLAQQLGWRQLDWQSEFAGARGSTSPSVPTAFCRPVTIQNHSYELQVMPIGNPAERVWRFQLQPTVIGEMIPAGFTLRLLSEDLQPFENNEASTSTPTESLYIDVAMAENEGIIWETEPQAEGYEREILRF